MNRKLSLGFSSCPNDTYIFDAIVNKRIDTEGLTFDLFMGDVEELNKKAMNGELDVSKLSFHAFMHLTNNYIALDSGSALGYNCGPLLIAKQPFTNNELETIRVAIPGELTTANLLLSLFYPQITNKTSMLFSTIEDSILNETIDAGLIIHENRFTYQAKGLVKIVDLGEKWQTETGCPIPLGGIFAKRTMPTDLLTTLNRVLRRSIEYANQNREDSLPYIRQHAQSMNDSVMNAHIALYVNDYSISLGTNGRKAIETLFEFAAKTGVIDTVPDNLFIVN